MYRPVHVAIVRPICAARAYACYCLFIQLFNTAFIAKKISDGANSPVFFLEKKVSRGRIQNRTVTIIDLWVVGWLV